MDPSTIAFLKGIGESKWVSWGVNLDRGLFFNMYVILLPNEVAVLTEFRTVSVLRYLLFIQNQSNVKINKWKVAILRVD